MLSATFSAWMLAAKSFFAESIATASELSSTVSPDPPEATRLAAFSNLVCAWLRPPKEIAEISTYPLSAVLEIFSVFFHKHAMTSISTNVWQDRTVSPGGVPSTLHTHDAGARRDPEGRRTDRRDRVR